MSYGYRFFRASHNLILTYYMQMQKLLELTLTGCIARHSTAFFFNTLIKYFVIYLFSTRWSFVIDINSKALFQTFDNF